MRLDARPQARKNRRCIRWNTSRIFSSREQRRRLQIVRRSRTVNVGQAPKREMPLTWLTKAAGLREAPRALHRMAARSI
jgi:hypothetical protein